MPSTARGQETKLTKNEGSGARDGREHGVEVFTVRPQGALGLSYYQTRPRLLNGYVSRGDTLPGSLEKCPAIRAL